MTQRETRIFRAASLGTALFLAAIWAAEAAVPAPADELRLDPAVAPVFQSIRLDLDADQTGYSGSVAFDLKVTKPTRSFRFHAEEMDLNRIDLKGPGGTIPLTHESGKIGLVNITTETPLVPGDYRLEIDFTNDFGTRAVGLYRVVQDDKGYSFTQFEADDAREAFPCWDEPIYKIPYQMTITVPEAHTAITNTSVEKETVADGRRTIAFLKTKPMPTYLIAIATGPLETTPIPGLSVPGRVVTVQGRSGMTGAAADLTPSILSATEKYFERSYPYEKLDLIAIPDYWPGAMENPGAVTYAEPILLLDPKTASRGQRRSLARVTAHELAHMWFGDLVTMEWWDDLWLNESFADWMGDKITDQVHPEFETGLNELDDIQRTMIGDARPSAQPIRRTIKPDDNMLENVGTAYNKGKAVLGMFEQFVGPEAFRKGVLDYIEANAWGNATADDLWKALSKVSGDDIAGAMATFLEQPGLPLVTVEPLGGGKVRVSQQRFLNHGADAPAQTWKIPVTLKYAGGESVGTRTILLSGPTQEVDLKVSGTIDWIVPDADARGYYRWSVPDRVLAHLAAESTKVLNERERVAFIGNLSALLSAGRLSGGDYLRALGHFAEDPEPVVLSSLIDALAGVKQAFVPETLEDAYAAWVRRTLEPALDRFGLDPKPGEPESVALLRPSLLAILGDEGKHEPALAHAGKLAKAYMADPASIDPTMASVALRLAAVRGDRKLFEEYKKRFETTQIPAERSRYLTAMGHFRQSELIEEALKYSLEGPLRPREIFSVTTALGETPQGRDRRYRYMTENYETITSRMPSQFAGFLPFFASGCEPERVEAARKFFSEPEHAAAGTESNLAKVADSVNDCAGLRARESAAVTSFLTQVAGDR